MGIDNAAVDSISDRLCQQYGLDFDPFLEGGSPESFFGDGRRGEVYRELVHQLHYGAGIALLSGERGSGKSRLAQAIVDLLAGVMDYCWIDADVWTDISTVLSELEATLQLDLPPSPTLEDFLDQIVFEDAEPILLVISSAQNASEQLIRELIQLHSSSENILRLLIVTEDSDDNSLDLIEVSRYALGPLSPLEAKSYIEFCLDEAGGDADALEISVSSLDQLIETTQGNIAAIRREVYSLLLPEEAIADRGMVSLPVVGRWPKMHVFALLGLMVALLWLALYQEGAEKENPAHGVEEVAQQPQPVLRQPLPLARSEPAPVAVDEPDMEILQASPVSDDRAERGIMEEELASPSGLSQAVAENVEVKAAEPLALAGDFNSPNGELVEPKAVSDEPVSSSPLSSFAESDWVLQVAGFAEQAAVDRFLQSQVALTDLFYVRTERDGKPWFIVLQGPFKSKEAAKAAIPRLPSRVRKAGPWPRSVASVSKLL